MVDSIYRNSFMIVTLFLFFLEWNLWEEDVWRIFEPAPEHIVIKILLFFGIGDFVFSIIAALEPYSNIPKF